MKAYISLGDFVVRKFRLDKEIVNEVYHFTSQSGEVDYYQYRLIGGDIVKDEDVYLVGKRPDGTPLQCNDLVKVLWSTGWDIEAVILDILYCEKYGQEKELYGFVLSNNEIVRSDEVIYWGTVAYNEEKKANVVKGLFDEVKDGK